MKYLNQIRKIRKIKLAVGLALVISTSVGILGFNYLQADRSKPSIVNNGSKELNSASYLSVGTENSVLGEHTVDLKFIDSRAYVLDEYFRVHNSPLYGSGKYFVAACDRHGAPADCTTLAAIARAETNLCSYHVSAAQHNCWGYGGGGTDRIYFKSWKEATEIITERLVNAYGYQYMVNPSLMETTFCGSEPGCTGWGNRVKFFMNEISEFALQTGHNRTLLSYR